MHCTEAICPGVSAPNNNDAFAGRQNIKRWVEHIAVASLIGLRQVLHREVDTLQVPSRNLQVARSFSAAGEQDGVELTLQVFNRNRTSHVCVGHELDALGFHLLKPAVYNTLLHLEFWDPVPQQSAGPISFFINRDPMSGAIQLLSRCQPCRTGTDNCYFLARANFWPLRMDKSVVESE